MPNVAGAAPSAHAERTVARFGTGYGGGRLHRYLLQGRQHDGGPRLPLGIAVKSPVMHPPM